MDNYYISARELNALRRDKDFSRTYYLLDIRDEAEFSYGYILGAVNIPQEVLSYRLGEIPRDKQIIVYCKQGVSSKEAACLLRENGYAVMELHGGYSAWLPVVMEEQQQRECDIRRHRADITATEYSSLADAAKAESCNMESKLEYEKDFLTQETRNYCNKTDNGEEMQRAGEKQPVEETLCERVEKSIRKKFHKQLFSKFAKAINTYNLLEPGDKVAVCISGGKDSMLLAKLFQELKRHRKFEFELVFLVMDPGYNELNRKMIEQNAANLNIPITIFESTIFDTVVDIEKSPCYLCARMRRGSLYSKAKELGCNKIALGHHYDDVIETILMGMLYGGQVQTMMPKLHSTNFEGMELIRPMYLIREEDIKHWRDYNGLHFLQCACRFTEENTGVHADGSSGSKRMEIKHLIQNLKKTNPYVEANIFKSVENVNLSTVIAYKQDGVTHSFLENYQNVKDEE